MMGKPKIRFKGYNEDWEQRKFSELVTIERGGSPRPIDKFITNDENGLNWVKIGDAPEQGNYITQTAEKIRPEGLSKTREVHPGDLILSNSMSFGRPYIMAIDGCIHDGWLAIRNTQKNFDLKFLCTLLGTDGMLNQYKAMAAGSTVNNLNKELVGGTTIAFPIMEEQIKIGEYFSNIDHLITLHQRKICIFIKKMPIDWEQRKLGEVVEFLDTMRKPLEGAKRISGPYPYYGASGIVDYVDGYLFDEELILLSEDGANITDRNYPVCFLASGKYWVNNHAHVLKTKEGNENNFICNSLERKDYKQYNTGMAMPKLNQEVCKGIPISCPTFAEQKKIGDYFRRLDHLITLHHRECVILQKTKVNDWEQRKFGDFTWDAGKRNKEDLDLEPYAITNEHGFIRQCDAHDDFGYMKDTDRKAYNIVKPNSFAYNPARINVGSIGYYKGVENVIVSSLYEVFQTDNYVNDRFLWHWFKSDEFPRWIERLQEGSVRLYFYYDKLCECQLYMPSLEEQEKIASFLDNLDHLITLHQHKCDELQNLKKYMLQNMFV